MREAPLDRDRVIVGVAILAGLAWFVESLDIGAIGTVVAALKQVYAPPALVIGLLGVASTAGIVVGLIPAGRLADRYGRKRILVLGVIEYAVLSGLSGLSPNLQTLIGLRFLAGLGMGAVFPIPYTLIAELAHSGHRAFLNSLMDACLSVGYFLAPLLGLVIMPLMPLSSAWRVYLLLTASPLIYAYFAHRYLPESDRWAGVKDQVAGRATGPAFDYARVWRAAQYLRVTVVGTAGMISSLLMFYVVLTYMPLILSGRGFSFADSLAFTAMITAFAIPGKLLNGILSDRLGRKVTFVVFTLLAALGAIFFEQVTTSFAILTCGAIMSFFGTGTFPGLKMYYAEQYETPIRASGTATVETISRFVAGVAALTFFPLATASLGSATVFDIIAAVAVLGALVVALVGRETAHRSLDQLEAAGTLA